MLGNAKVTGGQERQGAEESQTGLKIPASRHSLSEELNLPASSHGVHPSQGDIYYGSLSKSRQQSRTSLGGSPSVSRPVSQASTSDLKPDSLLPAQDIELETYGVEELRDGHFDASFYRPPTFDRSKLRKKALETLPKSFQKTNPLSLRQFLPKQWREIKSFVEQITTTRSGIKLMKSFSAYFIAYIICLIPISRDWLGRYNYIIPISVLVNHPGRAIGSQVEGTVLTIVGTVAGLGWGSLALFVSTSTSTARNGYGGVLATFLVLFTITIGWLRCFFIRFFQGYISAGFAIFYTCLADTSEAVSWKKLFDYGIPWVFGQVLGLGISFVICPETGSRPLALSLHGSLSTIKEGLTLPRQDVAWIRRDLTWNFVDLSDAVRDFTIDISVSRFDPEDTRILRNRLQAVIRGILAIRPDTALFDKIMPRKDVPASPSDANIDYEIAAHNLLDPPDDSANNAISMVQDFLARPVRNLIDSSLNAVSEVDSALMALSGYSKSIQPLKMGPWELARALQQIKESIINFDRLDVSLINHPLLPRNYADHPRLVELFLFIHPVRQAANQVEALLQKTIQMQSSSNSWRVNLPSYPVFKSMLRTNAQVRHDRGGLTAGFYFRSQKQLDDAMDDLRGRVYVPPPRRPNSGSSDIGEKQSSSDSKTPENTNGMKKTGEATFRYKTWKLMHRLQGFESRFAFKVTLLTTLLSVPAWLDQSRDWWNDNELWWSVVIVWFIMHPRVGGNFQDLMTRVLCSILGSIWGGFAYAASHGNPYVMAVFAVIFMIPMLYRFTISSHPRSGVVGCISFTVVSLSIYTNGGEPFKIAWTRGAAFVIGIIAAIALNWALWPFVARHELRKALSAMLLYSAILYRGIISKYIYFTEGEEPQEDDIARSEMLEARLREGFVRLRELLELTRHEIRLRAPFDPLPYSALIDACERFFEHLVEIRQSSEYFQPYMLARGESATEMLIGARRDAVAAILINLYVLGGALRSGRPVPRYLPSAAAARKRLLDRMAQVEAMPDFDVPLPRPLSSRPVEEGHKSRRWADVYQYAYSSALTDIVECLEQLQVYTKEITGEVGFELLDDR